MGNKTYCYKYPHPAVTTDCVVFGFDGCGLKVLLIKRGREPYKDCWAFPGGFLNPDESAEEGAIRELKEETGFAAGYMEQLHTYTNPGRDPRERVISIVYIALVEIGEVKGADDAAEAEWFPIDDIPPLAFDHDEILRDALARLRELIQIYSIDHEPLPEKFTLSHVQNLFDTVIGKSFKI